MTEANTPAGRIPRRHDLDALRGIAMMAGIVLHAAMSFIPGMGMIWPVTDARPSESCALLLAVIHGFRMPLFFVVSGFFTAMLFRKRGVWALLVHRFKRIFLPMMLALVTIIPATWAVSIYVKSEATQEASQNDGALIAAAAQGETKKVRSLLEGGASVNAVDDRQTTSLHIAAFFGHPEVARVLLDAGADTTLINVDGATPAAMLETSWELAHTIASAIGVRLDQEAFTEGRREIARMLDVPVDKIPDSAAAKPDAEKQSDAGWGELLDLLMYIPLWGHLWFLWFLCWLVPAYAIVMMVGERLRVPALPTWVTMTPWCYLWLIPLTAIPQAMMTASNFGSFGPATSIGLVPMPSVLGYYAIFFFFGAVYFDANDLDGRIGRHWPVSLGLALLVVFPLGVAMMLRGPAGTETPWFAVCQATYAWLATFGSMGLFRELLSKKNATMRYLSDSSYWLYLAHIPLVILLQYVVRDWGIPSELKMLFVCGVVSAILLATYQWCVRYTPIGTLLNGPRVRPATIDAVDVEVVGP